MTGWWVPSSRSKKRPAKYSAAGGYWARNFYRHIPRMRAPTSMRGPWLTARAAAPTAASGHVVLSNILSALREKPLKAYEIMKRANILNEEACQSLLLKMRDDGLEKFDIHKGRWLIG